MKKTENKRQQPFFATFLENQLPKKATASVQGGTDGPPIHTMSLADSPQTKKYPSDQEDPGTTNPDWDCIMTMKYPSDGDDDAPETI